MMNEALLAALQRYITCPVPRAQFSLGGKLARDLSDREALCKLLAMSIKVPSTSLARGVTLWCRYKDGGELRWAMERVRCNERPARFTLRAGILYGIQENRKLGFGEKFYLLNTLKGVSDHFDDRIDEVREDLYYDESEWRQDMGVKDVEGLEQLVVETLQREGGSMDADVLYKALPIGVQNALVSASVFRDEIWGMVDRGALDFTEDWRVCLAK